jgi:hypothetical protein
MKKSYWVLISSFVLCLLLASSASALTRMVLAEMFTNAG